MGGKTVDSCDVTSFVVENAETGKVVYENPAGAAKAMVERKSDG